MKEDETESVADKARTRAADWFMDEAVKFRTQAIGYDLEGALSMCHGIALGLYQAASECERTAKRILERELPLDYPS